MRGYGEVLRLVGESSHQGCLLVTGREALPELILSAGEGAPVRTMRLGSLRLEAGRALLQERGLTRRGRRVLGVAIDHYSGNPLALSVVGETISVVFGGDIATFLAQNTAIFGGIRQLLYEQVGRLSELERLVLNWLAVEREPVGFAELTAELTLGAERGEVVEAVEGCSGARCWERGGRGIFTLQPVVMEYATARLVATLALEILEGEPLLLISRDRPGPRPRTIYDEVRSDSSRNPCWNG